VRADGKGSKRLSKFNELLARLRVAVPDMVLQVGGSISFAQESEGEAAKWLSDDTRHMLAELTPKPDQVTVTVNTVQMNILEQMEPADTAGTSLAEPATSAAYRGMVVPAGPGRVEEHVRRHGAVLTLKSSMRNVLPINMIAIVMGLHVRCGIEDNLWTQDHKSKISTVRQIEQLVRLSREFSREVASGREARRICKIGMFYDSVEETLAKNGFAPNRQPRRDPDVRRMAA
jgi:uncharacterized protein (DUF849 family)